MNFSLIFRRARRSWRQLTVLLVAVCLVTAFFALAPLYVRAMVQSGLRYEISQLSQARLRLTLNNSQPFKPEDWTFLNDQLGALVKDLRRVSRSQSAFQGFDLNYGEPTNEFSGRSEFDYHAYAFSDLPSLVRVIDGRLPNRLPPPDSPEREARTEEERIDKGLGIYSVGDIEAVIGLEVARQTGYSVGTRVAIGVTIPSRAVVHIVGIVEAANPNDPIWAENRRALVGEEIQVGFAETVYQMAFITLEGAYSDWVAAATTQINGDENDAYVWYVGLNGGAVNADNLSLMRERLEFSVNKLAADYPGLISANPLLRLLDRFVNQVALTEPPVILLSGAVLVLMLYHLVTTVTLYLETQQEEWAALSSRGAGTGQLLRLQGGTMLILCLIGAAVGAPLASLILSMLWVISPIAAASGGEPPIAGIPTNAVILSVIAAALGAIMLTVPAIPAARRSLAQFKQIAARPPKKPLWARYSLDFVCIGLGIAFTARLLFAVQGDLGETLGQLLGNPRALIRQMLDGAARTGGLADPLNLLAPAFFLTGAALLWLRIFPLIMRVLGTFTRRDNGLTAPLAVWQVERDPNHYAQLVLLLIGTLALGTAALALGDTRDAGAWAGAQQATGGAVRIAFEDTVIPDVAEYAALDGVEGAASLIRIDSEQQAGTTSVSLLGVPLTLSERFPNTQEVTSALLGTNIEVRRSFDRQTRRPVETIIVPAVISQRMAEDLGRAQRPDQLPLTVGSRGTAEILLTAGVRYTLNFDVVGVVRDFPSLSEDQHFAILEAEVLRNAISRDPAAALMARPVPNQIWLHLSGRQPSAALSTALQGKEGVAEVVYAWDRYNELLREPLPAAIAGMLYAGFWVSLLLSLLDFAFYLAVTARRRALGFAVLRALGWNAGKLWLQLIAEQATLVLPALVVGVGLGALLAYIILPFLALVGGVALSLPMAGVVGLLAALIVGFAALSLGAAAWLRQLNINRVLRLGEE